ncbi:MAG TPA: DNA methyltransferase, partial [Acidimicrobiales bacterium]|nr:DNA methyltransferase [Acidimicrobiales bacterium]
LDPFAGSGTTGQVACQLGRDAILVDLDERNVELARKRIGPYGLLEVVGRDGRLSPAEGQGALL